MIKKLFTCVVAVMMTTAASFAQFTASSFLADGETQAIILGTYPSQGQNLPVLAAFQGQNYKLLIGSKSDNEQCFLVFPDRFRTGLAANLLKLKRAFAENKQAAINAFSVSENKDLSGAGITFPPVSSVRWMLLGNLYNATPAVPELKPFFVVAMDGAGNVSYTIKMEGDANSADYVSEHWVLSFGSEEEIDRLIDILKVDPAQRYSLSDEDITVNGITFKMIAVEGGSFTMGATPEQEGSRPSDRERPAHSVTVSSFYIGETEVTQALYQAVMGANPSGFKDPFRPVEKVTWAECQEFAARLSSLTGKTFRLPTEAEWEYAARGGNKASNTVYAGSNDINSVGWVESNAGNQTHIVKGLRPNELGIYDMSGNVWEYCQDWLGVYSGATQENPTGAWSGTERIRRGGSWRREARQARVSYRGHYNPTERSSNLGFRIVMEAK